MRLTPSQIQEIRALVSGAVRLNVPLSRLTSFRIGGPADGVAEPQSVAELAALVRFLHDNAIPHLMLGSGTNVLFHDAGFRGLIVRTNGLKIWKISSDGSEYAEVQVAAGVSLPLVVGRSCTLGWTGLEPLWGIPGSFGGAVVTNAGAGGASISDFLVSVKVVSAAGEEISLNKGELRAGYRSMGIPEDAAVAEGALRLHRGIPSEVECRLGQAKARRIATQPLAQPSAGCVFKNPSPERPAGAIIDRLGLKGTTSGGAMVSEAHANFIINRGNASAADVLHLIDLIRSKVKAEEHIDLELEIRLVGEASKWL
jgi:UDP-N-acetylmuramate dehydrogenase